MKPLVVAITGASGAAYAVRLLGVLAEASRDVHLVVSRAGAEVIRVETGLTVDPAQPDVRGLLPNASPEAVRKIVGHGINDYAAGIASGSFLTEGMVICPCSTDTLAAVAHGMASNLVHRAAAVHLKERRKLIVVPRETPLSVIQLANMTRLAEAGAVVLPAMPGFYRNATTVSDLVDFVVARVCDQLAVAHTLMQPWGEHEEK